MDSNWIHSPSGQNAGTSPKIVLVVSTILTITDEMEVICNLDVNLNMRWSWTMSWTRTRQFQIGLVHHLLVHVSLAVQHLLDVLFVLHGHLLDS
jgi:hypothetical protein